MAAGDGYARVKPHIKAKVPIAGGPPSGQMSRVNLPGMLPWASFGWIDTLEHVPDLIWPTSVKTYSSMRKDAQVGGLYLGVTLPIRRYKWCIVPNGAKEEIVKAISEDFNLPIQGDDEKPSVSRAGGTFSFDEFLRIGLLALAYGFYDFELVGDITKGKWRMKKMSPIPPATVVQKEVADNGDLISLKQSVGVLSPEIPASRLCSFCWDKEGGNWFGNSMFRTMYKHWLIKDRLMRVDAIHHDRNGLGIPIIEAPAGAGIQQLQYLDNLAQNFRAGDQAGAAIPNGAKLTLVGTTGSTSNPLTSINYHDEAMARALLMMFIQLGQTTHGSRALGDSFLNYFSLAQETIALWFEDVTTQSAIEQWVNWNYSEDEIAPRLGHERNQDPDLGVTDLDLLIKDGAIKVDPDFEDFIRSRFMLPTANPESPEPVEPIPTTIALPIPVASPTTGTPEQQPTAAPVPSPEKVATPMKGRRRSLVAASGPSLLPLPSRNLRRQLYTQEVRAAVDYAAMDSDFESARAALLVDVQHAQETQINELHEGIIEAKGNLTKLAKLTASPIHADTILARMTQLATTGAYQAINEAKRQGKAIGMPSMDKVLSRLKNRAVATDSLLASSLSETAGRKALSLTGPDGMTSTAVADNVKEYLHSLKGPYLSDQLGGALQVAMNAGRKEVMDSADPSEIYASELLDSATCENCVAIDGTQYIDMASADGDYPTGGYMDCLGGPRCRGTVIAVYAEADAAS